MDPGGGREFVKSVKISKDEEYLLRIAVKEGRRSFNKALKDGLYMKQWKLFDKGKTCHEGTYLKAVSVCLGVPLEDLVNLREEEKEKVRAISVKNNFEENRGMRRSQSSRHKSRQKSERREDDIMDAIEMQKGDSFRSPEKPLTTSRSQERRGRSRSKENHRRSRSRGSSRSKSRDRKESRSSVESRSRVRRSTSRDGSKSSPSRSHFNSIKSEGGSKNSIAGNDNESLNEGFIMTRNHLMVIMWLVWLVFGSIFYAVALDLNPATGFYMAVNIGYSIGFGDIPETGELGSQWFSTVYVLIGASFVGAALGVFAEHIVADKDNWYEQERENLQYEENTKDCNAIVKGWHFCWYHKKKFRSIVLWVLFIVVATLCAWDTNEEFNFINSLYFAVSSLSTGGHYALPGGNREWVYGLTGLYCALGIPLMGVAMATVASFFIKVGSIEDTLEDMKAPISQMEIKMLTEFGLADDDGEIDKSEFIILCMVRIGAASPELIKLIEQYFNELDTDNSGSLSIDEILRHRKEANAAAGKLLDQVRHHEHEDGGVLAEASQNQKKRRHSRHSYGSSSSRNQNIYDDKV